MVPEKAVKGIAVAEVQTMRPEQLAPKVFCIGLSKTGTTSLGDALAMLGLNRLTWSRALSQPLLNSALAGEFQPLFDVAYRFDALEDMPWPLAYRELDVHFPNAQFILTRRKNVKTWLRSMNRQTIGKPRWRVEAYRQIYGHHFVYENPKAFAEYYDRHNAAALAYFAGRGAGKLLDICFDDGDGWDRLCDFLGRSLPDKPFPHSNHRERHWYKELYLNAFFHRQLNLSFDF